MAKLKDTPQAPKWSNFHGEGVSSLRLAEEVSYQANQRLRQYTLLFKEAKYLFSVLMDMTAEACEATEDYCCYLSYPEVERARAAFSAACEVGGFRENPTSYNRYHVFILVCSEARRHTRKSRLF